jgi:hypothetical protein
MRQYKFASGTKRLSDFTDSHLGVKQGDPLSPLMFMFFINDIHVCANMNADVDGIFTVDKAKMFMLLYADDAVLFATTKEALQHRVNEVKTYSENWNLKVTTAKTKIMVFEKRGASNP